MKGKIDCENCFRFYSRFIALPGENKFTQATVSGLCGLIFQTQHSF